MDVEGGGEGTATTAQGSGILGNRKWDPSSDDPASTIVTPVARHAPDVISQRERYSSSSESEYVSGISNEAILSRYQSCCAWPPPRKPTTCGHIGVMQQAATTHRPECHNYARVRASQARTHRLRARLHVCCLCSLHASGGVLHNDAIARRSAGALGRK